jgi:uncharacterized damage-inducible protein DinB
MRDVLMTRWSEIGDKIVELAAELPAEKYEFRPTPAVRSFADQLRHLAFWNTYVHKTLRREAPDGQANELPREAYPTKPKIMAVLRTTFDEVKSELANGGGTLEGSDADMLLSFIEHSGEHYGQLVVYYRLNGLVPPASR